MGKKIVVDGIGRTVIGVMPAGFAFPADAGLWLPLEVGADPGNFYFRPCIGRLRPDVSPRQALAELKTLVTRFPVEPGSDRNGMSAEVLPLKEMLVGQIRKSLLVFLGAVAFVLLIACANVANLLLMRGSLRRQEMAVRTALGANRGRLIRQLLTESILISFAGAATGMMLAVFGVQALLALAPAGRVPRIEEIHMDAAVLAFALGLGALTGVLFGLLPALQSTGRELRTSLGQAGRAYTGRREGIRGALVVSEIALTVVLLTGAGLLLKSFLRMRAVDPGFRPENVITMTVDLPEATFQTAPALRSFHTRVLEKLAALPGVSSAGAVNWLPLGRALIQGNFHTEGATPMPQGYVVDKVAVSPDYFRTMGIRLLSGRPFGGQDNSTAPAVAIVSESVARTLWPGGDAAGKRITLEDHAGPGDWMTIVGVAAGVRQEGLAGKQHAAIYRPYTQVTHRFFLSHMTFAVRTPAGVPNVAAAMRGVLRQVDRNQPPQTVAAMSDLVAADTAEPRFQARLISTFSMLALLLAAIGVYGVLACAVAERTREIGIRIALGAAKSDIRRMVLQRVLLLVAAGLSAGVAGALAMTRVLGKFLFEVKPTDPATFLLVAALLAAVGLLAGLLPARRAARVDPLTALRCE